MENQQISEIIAYLTELHEKHADGCKSSCWEREIGYYHSNYYESYWYCRFGGYCIGTLNRYTEIHAKELNGLLPNIKNAVEKALE